MTWVGRRVCFSTPAITRGVLKHTLRVAAVLMVWAHAAAGAEKEVRPDTEELARRAWRFFENETDPRTGITKDRASNSVRDNYTIGSIASTGFYLAALPVAVERGWIERQKAAARGRTTLSFFRDRMTHEHGWFYHFVNIRDGRREWQCELSSIDTALFLAGALTAGAYFKDSEVPRLADEIYRRVDFQWMLTDGGQRPDEKTLCHGWKPESGFLKNRWDHYCELMVLYLLAMGSPTHPIPADSWDAFRREMGEYAGHRTFRMGPLFTHQYSHAFIDFRGRRDRLGFGYFQASVAATLANRQFCIDQSRNFRTYSADTWGLSATDGPDGYKAYAAPPGEIVQDGTISPWNTAASIVFTPELCERAIAQIRLKHPKAWGRYGFASGINVDRDYISPDVIGIDVGAALLMIENQRSGLVWRLFMSPAPVRAGLRQAGFAGEAAEENAKAPSR